MPFLLAIVRSSFLNLVKNLSASELGGIIKVRDLQNRQSLPSVLNASLLLEMIGSDVDAFWIIGRNACKNIFDSFVCDMSLWFNSNSYAVITLVALDGLMFSWSMKPLILLTATGLSGWSSRDLRVEPRA